MRYDHIVFTKHALERIELRKINQDMVIKTIRDPNKQFAEPNGNVKFIRKVSGCKVHAVCKPLPEENKWLVLSVWVRGEDDQGRHTTYHRGSRNRRYNRKTMGGLPAGFLIVVAILLYTIWNMSPR